jgi:putative ABC transport system permease protein
MRTVVRIVVLAAAVALLGSMLLFIGHSLRTMAGSAIRSVPVDWQGPVDSYTQAVRVASDVARQSWIEQASPAATAPFIGASHTGRGGTTNAGNGSILAIPPGYRNHIDTFRFLQGTLRSGQIVLDQQMAATLRAQIGDTVSFRARKGGPMQRFKVSGVALITAPDVVFQPLNPLLGPAPAQPPSNAAILPLKTFATTIGRQLSSIGAGGPQAGTTSASAVPGAQTGVQWQVQVQVGPSGLGNSPGQAFTRAGQVVHRIERTLPGQVQFVDNLSDTLNTAASDALYAETLYIMLAVPGALVALGLAFLAALGSVQRDRRDLALLRARGASRRWLLGVALADAALIGAVAGALGTGLALAAVALIIKGGLGLSGARIGTTFAACIALALVGALAVRIGATVSVWRASVAESRRSTQRERKLLWQRLYLDLAALAVSGLVWWLTAKTGFSAVVNPDSNPTLSLSVYMFFAPALLWIGATLLLVRLRGGALAWLARRAAGRPASGMRSFLLASAGRRGQAINRGLVVVALLLAFGVELGIFTATYDQQATVDAQLTIGGDITASAPPGVTAKEGLEAKIAAVAGVQGTTAVDHSYAYVGPDLQDTFGINPNTITRGTTLRDSYFIGGNVHSVLTHLRASPDAILVSNETIADYQLHLGDLLKLRVLDRANGMFRVVPFHVAGVVQEFPSAPRDSFMVANLSYLQAADHAGGPNVVFAKSGSPGTTAAAVADATAGQGTIVRNISQQAQQTVSSITTVDLRGISQIEEVFTIALAAAAMALFVALAVIERRHEFATMAAVGAGLRSIAAFVWSEAALVLIAALLLAAGLGTLLAYMLVAMLQHVFDPPPDHLAVPWAYLAGLAGAALLSAAVAAGISGRALHRLPLGRLLREQ